MQIIIFNIIHFWVLPLVLLFSIPNGLLCYVKIGIQLDIVVLQCNHYTSLHTLCTRL